jgi:hypothetical protein
MVKMAKDNLFDEFNKLQREIDKIADKTMKKIAREYAEALEETRNIIRKRYDKYANEDGELTYEEMTKYTRKKKLDAELAAAVQATHVSASKLTREVLRQTYKSSFTTTQKFIEDAAERVIRGQVKNEVVQKALQMPVSGLTLNDRLERRRRYIIGRVRETVGQGLYQGETYSNMSKRLKKTLEGDVEKAERIVRTESHRVMEKSKYDSVEHAVNQGVDMKKYWMSSEDERVRSSHNHMDSKYNEDDPIPVDQDFVNEQTGGKGPTPGQLGVAADDINCRCIAGYVVNTDDE